MATTMSRTVNPRRSWNQQAVIDVIVERHRLGLTLYPQRLQDEFPSLLAAGRRYFGSWPKALQAAKIPALRRLPSPRHRRGFWTEERLVSSIRAHAAQGHPLYAHAMQQMDNRLVSAATYHFGSWARALQVAGFDAEDIRANRRRSPEAIIEEISELRRRGEDLRDSQVRRQHRSLYWAARKYFGSWQEALQSLPQA